MATWVQADDEKQEPGWNPRFVHLHQPDYNRAILKIPPAARQAIMDKLAFLYGHERALLTFEELERVMQVYYAHKPVEMIEAEKSYDPANRFTEKDVVLITYGDSVHREGKQPLQALSDLVKVLCRELINTIHILPFFPYSSDRGFAIVDFEEVDPKLGTWKDIENLSRDFKLMFDGVINHVSSRSRWFQNFLNGHPFYENYFITFSRKEDITEEQLKLILRPRTTPLLTPYQTIKGPKMVWTTFSSDQADLNYKNEMVLIRVVEILLHYVRRGADIIRLDAVTYLWEEVGTTSAHLKQTHTVVQLLRTILDVVAPHVALLTETNVPHEQNISYFGDGADEAQMVYNFALPPLVLHAFLTGDCSRLTAWAAMLEQVSDTATYFNFLDSHDGVGLLPVKNILSEDERDYLVERAREHGGLVSYRDKGDGTKEPYELNITWFNALNGEDAADDLDVQVERFVASRAIALALMGVPGIYLPSLFGGRNDQEGVRVTGEARSINRGVLDEKKLFELLGDSSSPFYRIADKFFDLLERRIQNPAFHPNAAQRVLGGNKAVFALLRESPDGSEQVLTLTNVSNEPQQVVYLSEEVGVQCKEWVDLLSEERISGAGNRIGVRMKPYQVVWLRAQR